MAQDAVVHRLKERTFGGEHHPVPLSFAMASGRLEPALSGPFFSPTPFELAMAVRNGNNPTGPIAQ